MEHHIKDILNKFVEQKSISEGVFNERIKKFWNDQMGRTITERTTQLSLHKNVLTIGISSASLKHELFSSREKLRSLINDHLGKEVVRSIHFR
jgi:hypothetical protein